MFFVSVGIKLYAENCVDCRRILAVLEGNITIVVWYGLNNSIVVVYGFSAEKTFDSPRGTYHTKYDFCTIRKRQRCALTARYTFSAFFKSCVPTSALNSSYTYRFHHFKSVYLYIPITLLYTLYLICIRKGRNFSRPKFLLYFRSILPIVRVLTFQAK